MALCCPGLSALISNAGKRGLAVAVELQAELFRFLLQARALTPCEVEELKGVTIPQLPTYMTLSSRMTIRYCPSCGSSLASLAAADPERFTELARMHADFVEA